MLGLLDHDHIGAADPGGERCAQPRRTGADHGGRRTRGFWLIDEIVYKTPTTSLEDLNEILEARGGSYNLIRIDFASTRSLKRSPRSQQNVHWRGRIIRERSATFTDGHSKWESVQPLGSAPDATRSRRHHPPGTSSQLSSRLGFAVEKFGSPGRARTADLVINSHPLYQLSYRGLASRGWYRWAKPAVKRDIKVRHQAVDRTPRGSKA